MIQSTDRPENLSSRMSEVSISRVMAGLPDTIAVLFRRMMRAPRRSSLEMRRRVSRHIVDMETRAREADYVDVELAQSLANECHRLIDTLGPDASEEHYRLVQAAVLYFVTDEDAEGDASSLIGFDDDRLVVRRVLSELERVGIALPER